MTQVRTSESKKRLFLATDSVFLWAKRFIIFEEMKWIFGIWQQNTRIDT